MREASSVSSVPMVFFRRSRPHIPSVLSFLPIQLYYYRGKKSNRPPQQFLDSQNIILKNTLLIQMHQQIIGLYLTFPPLSRILNKVLVTQLCGHLRRNSLKCCSQVLELNTVQQQFPITYDVLQLQIGHRSILGIMGSKGTVLGFRDQRNSRCFLF